MTDFIFRCVTENTEPRYFKDLKRALEAAYGNGIVRVRHARKHDGVTRITHMALYEQMPTWDVSTLSELLRGSERTVELFVQSSFPPQEHDFEFVGTITALVLE